MLFHIQQKTLKKIKKNYNLQCPAFSIILKVQLGMLSLNI